MGIDHRPGKGDEYLPQTPGMPTDPGRSDTMAVLSIDASSKTAALLSIPRDLWLEEPDGNGGWAMDRINEPYHTGEIDKLPGGGGALAAQAITHNFGIPIDYYVDFDFNSFMALIDALGGIDLNVPAQITATVLPAANTGAYEYTYFPGQQHLNGELALAYSRFRLDSEGDLGRIQRQQAVALAARQKAMALGWVDHPLTIWQKYDAAVSTNIPAYMVPGLALLAKQIESNGITTRSLGEAAAVQLGVIPGSGAQVLFPNPEVVAQIVSETFNNPSYGQTTLAQLQRLYPAPRRPVATGNRGQLPTLVPPPPQ
jgi:LCP family protein required for cell wall assembly